MEQPDLINQRLETILVGEDGSVTHEFVDRETPLDTSDHHAFHDAEWVSVRRKRDALLTETDWVSARAADLGMPVAPEWAAYRQALRDITLQKNPFFLEWPVKPTTPVVVYTVAARTIVDTPPEAL